MVDSDGWIGMGESPIVRQPPSTIHYPHRDCAFGICMLIIGEYG